MSRIDSPKEMLEHYINDAHGEGYDTVELPIETARDILSRLGIAEKALEKFTRDKFYRSIENDTWSHMVHMEKEPWEIAHKALQQLRL